MRMFLAERRPVFLFRTFGENLKSYGKDLDKQYLSGPYDRKDPIQKGLGPVMAAGSLILEGTDQLWAGVVDQRLDVPTGIAGRTRRDIKLLLKDIVTLHPLRAIGDGFRLAFADVPLDIGDTVGGFRLNDRHRMDSAMTKEPLHATAA